MPRTFTGGYEKRRETPRPQGEKFSVTEFNDNPEVKRLSRTVHRYLNKNALPGSKLLGIKERPDEYLDNPAESIRDEMLSLTTLGARRAAINNAPENVKKAYARLLDIWENETEIKGFGETLTAAKDYAIDILTSPETYIGFGAATAGKTALQTALKGAGVGASWAGSEDFIRQSKDVEINRLDQISAPQVLATTAFGAGGGFILGGAGHKLAKHFENKVDPRLSNKAESEDLEVKLAKDETVPVADKEIPKDDVDKLRDTILEAKRELALRETQYGTQRPKGFIRDQAREPVDDAPLQFGSRQDEIIETDADLIRDRPSRDFPIDPAITEFNKKHGGGGSKTDEELNDIIRSTMLQLEGQSDEVISNALQFETKKFANNFPLISQLVFKPATLLDSFTKYSTVAKSLQQKFRYDAQRDLFGASGARTYDKQDFGEVFKEILGDNYVTFKDALHPIQSTMSGKLELGINNVLRRALIDPDKVSLDEFEVLSTSYKEIRTLLDNIGDQLLETGAIRNKVENNYFPRLWDRKAIENNIDDFKSRLVKVGEAKDLVEADEIVTSMLNKNNQLDQGGGGGAGFFYNRVFKTKLDDEFSDYLDTDINSVMLNYIAQSSKAIAKRKVFGVNNLDEFTGFYIDGIDAQMKKAGRSLTLKDKKKLQKLYNHATGENLSRFEGGTGFAVDLYGSINRMAYLPLATISSLTEIFINVAKAGPTSTIKGLFSALNTSRGTIQDKSLQLLKKKGLTEKEAWRELQEFGMALDPVLVDTVERLSGSMVRNQTLQKINNAFFRATFLDQWTKFVQLASYKTGKDLISKNLREINKLSGAPDSRRIRNMKDQLNELGVDIDQGLKWINEGEALDDPFYKNIKRGAARYTNEVILMPTGESGLKPFWTGDPKTSILFQFLGYPIAFTNTVLKNAAKDIIRNPVQNAPKTLAAGLIMTEVARWTNWARSHGKSEENKSPLEIYMAAIRRWGGNGIVEDLFTRGRKAAEVYQDPVAMYSAWGGPVGNDLYKIIKRGDFLRIMGEKIPGYGALGFVSPEAKKAYTEWLKEKSKEFRKGSLEFLGIEKEVQPARLNRAEGGEIKEEVSQHLKDNAHLNFVQRIFNPELTIELEKGRPSTHMMASAEVDGKEIVYPTIVEIEPGKLKQLSSKEAIRYALKTGEYIEFDNVKEARAFAEGAYKKGTRLNKAKGGEVDVPNAAPEPDERIDRMTGLPYNLQAGIPFRDEEDPIKRLGLAGGGRASTPMQRLGFEKGGFLKDLAEKAHSVSAIGDKNQMAIAKKLGFSEEHIRAATNFGKTFGEHTQVGGRGDAARHIMLGWAAAQTKNPNVALKIINARDYGLGTVTGEGVLGIKMDTHNNQVGFSIGDKSIEEAQEIAAQYLKDGTAKVNK